MSHVSEAADSLRESGDLTPADLPERLHTPFDEAGIVALGEAFHGTREFDEHRFRLTQLLVEEFGARAIGFEAGFDPLCRVADRVVAGEGRSGRCSRLSTPTTRCRSRRWRTCSSGSSRSTPIDRLRTASGLRLRHDDRPGHGGRDRGVPRSARFPGKPRVPVERCVVTTAIEQ